MRDIFQRLRPRLNSPIYDSNMLASNADSLLHVVSLSGCQQHLLLQGLETPRYQSKDGRRVRITEACSSHITQKGTCQDIESW
jgi:hypothetical protein